MPKFRKKPIVVEATQWFKSGDHPDDACETFTGVDGEPFLGEGKVVRYFRRPDVPGKTVCWWCARVMHDHGFVDTSRGGHVVCPGDWIVTDVDAEGHYPCKDDVFRKTYVPVDAAIAVKWDAESGSREAVR